MTKITNTPQVALPSTTPPNQRWETVAAAQLERAIATAGAGTRFVATKGEYHSALYMPLHFAASAARLAVSALETISNGVPADFRRMDDLNFAVQHAQAGIQQLIKFQTCTPTKTVAASPQAH